LAESLKIALSALGIANSVLLCPSFRISGEKENYSMRRFSMEPTLR